MNFARLREFEDLFGHRWDALALLCLAEQAQRFNQLARIMNTNADERLPDNVLSRSLHRLIARELVTKTDERGERYPTYTLTISGVRRATRLASYLKHLDDGPEDVGDV